MGTEIKAAVITAGEWGTASSVPLSDNGVSVYLYNRHPDQVKYFNRHHKLPQDGSTKLSNISFPNHVRATADIEEAITDADLVIYACKSSVLREVSNLVEPLVNPLMHHLSLIKGIERGTGLLPSEVIVDVNPSLEGRISTLAGPNFALNVAQRSPTTTLIASESEYSRDFLQSLYHTPFFRVYTNPDLRGLELAAAGKNVTAVGAGAGLGTGLADAGGLYSFASRGLFEIAQLIAAEGGRFQTAYDADADHFMTCTYLGEPRSRNLDAGIRIGRGEDPQFILNGPETVEGLIACDGLIQRADRYGVEMPIMRAVKSVVHKEIGPKEAIYQLLKREPRKVFA